MHKICNKICNKICKKYDKYASKYDKYAMCIYYGKNARKYAKYVKFADHVENAKYALPALLMLSKFSISESLWLDFEMCLFGIEELTNDAFRHSSKSLYSFNEF